MNDRMNSWHVFFGEKLLGAFGCCFLMRFCFGSWTLNGNFSFPGR